MNEFKASGTTDVKALAGAIERNVHKNGSVELSAIGGRAVNQATKAIALAGKLIKHRNVDLIVHISSETLTWGDKKKTAIKFIVGKEKY